MKKPIRHIPWKQVFIYSKAWQYIPDAGEHVYNFLEILAILTS